MHFPGSIQSDSNLNPRYIHKFLSCVGCAYFSIMGLSSPASAEYQESSIPINDDLEKFNERFLKPELVQLAPGVYAARNYSYSNFSFIEGKSGWILVDTGWFEPGFAKALEAIKRISDKPVSAIILTHNHEDHTGGGGLAVESAVPNVPIYAVANFDRQREYDAGPMRLLIQKRNFAQTGLALDELKGARRGVSVGPMPEIGVRRETVPNTYISKDTTMVIDGVKLRLIPGGSDVSENLMIYMPDAGVLFSGDIVGGVYPYIETPRYEPRRDPRAWIDTLTVAMSLKPGVVVSGHGRVMQGAEDSQKTLAANREIIEYTVDQVERMLLEGYSAEQIVHEFRLPDHLKNNPDLQPYYHKIDWVLRGLITKRVGYYTAPLDLFRLDGVSESERIVALAGGKDAVLQTARSALDSGDARWAAHLSGYLLNLDEGDPAAKEIWAMSLEAIARDTTSINERNYALTEAGIARGQIDLDERVRSGMAEGAKGLSNNSLLFAFKSRFRAEDVKEGEGLCASISIDGKPAGYYEISGTVLRYEGQPACSPQSSIMMSRQTLIDLYSGALTWQDALRKKMLAVKGNAESVRKFSALMD